MLDIPAVGRSPKVTSDNLVERLQVSQDVAAIKDLVAIYPVLVDTHDLEHLVQTFAETGEISRAGSVHRGHADLRVFYAHIFDLFSVTMHTQHHHVVQVARDGRTASGLTFGHSENATADAQYNAAFRYDDEYVKIDDAWKFGRRRMRYQYMTTAEGMATRLEGRERVRLPGSQPQIAEIPEETQSWQVYATTRGVTGSAP